MWEDLSPRFLPFGVSLGIVLIPIEQFREPGARVAAAASVAAFALASIGWAWLHHARLSLASADIMAVAEQPVRRSGPRLPVILKAPEGSVAEVDENEGIGNILAIEQGGMTPYFYATRPGLHPFVWKRPRRELFPPAPPRFYAQMVRVSDGDPGQPPRDFHLARLALLGAAYEDVILWGRATDLEAFEARGYLADARQGQAAIMHFSPCGLDVAISTSAQLESPLLVQYGWVPLVEATDSHALAAGNLTQDGIARTRFDAAPCGPVWVRVLWDLDRSGDLSKGDVLCEGADEAGRVFANIDRGHHAVRCSPSATAAMGGG
jgi:hypothetical protein